MNHSSVACCRYRTKSSLGATADGKEADILVGTIFGTVIVLGLLIWLICYCLRKTDRIDIFMGNDRERAVDEVQAANGSDKSKRPKIGVAGLDDFVMNQQKDNTAHDLSGDEQSFSKSHVYLGEDADQSKEEEHSQLQQDLKKIRRVLIASESGTGGSRV